MQVIYVNGANEAVFEVDDYMTHLIIEPKIILNRPPSSAECMVTSKVCHINIQTYRNDDMRKEVKLATTDTLSQKRIDDLLYRYGSYYSRAAGVPSRYL
ncbi:MAG: hypothetical protein WAU54_05940 [Chania sp.]